METVVINAGIGTITANTENFQLQLILEALKEKIESVGVLSTLQSLQL